MVAPGGGGVWGTLNFVLERTPKIQSIQRTVTVLNEGGSTLTLSFKFPGELPATARPSGFGFK